MKHFYLTLLLLFTTLCFQAQIVTIPDVNFLNALLNSDCADFDGDGFYESSADLNEDGQLQLSEVQQIIRLNITGREISNLSGIEEFINLTHLYCGYNQLSFLDLSDNVLLEFLDCENNIINSLNISNNPNLIEIVCTYNQLTSLDASSSVNLEILTCGYNNITNLDINNNLFLQELGCPSNALTSLDVSNNTNLLNLGIFNNQITSLDLSNNILLSSVSCENNELNTLILGNNNNLSYLNCYGNNLTSLDLTNVPNLSILECFDNNIVNLDLSNNTLLNSLFCFSNPLESLTLINNTELTGLSVLSPQLSNLILQNNTALSDIDCSGGQLINLELNNNTALQVLNCSNNQISSLILDNSPLLRELNCYTNQITNIDFNESILIEELDCGANQIYNLDLSDLNNLYGLYTDNNPNLQYINLKNGNNNNFVYSYLADLPSLQAVCLDDLNSSFANTIESEVYENVVITEYCSFTPGGEFYTINGNIILDADNDGCDSEDVVYPNLMLQTTNGLEESVFLSNTDGSYTMPIPEGNYTITPQLENPTYFTVTPASIFVDFPSEASPFLQDFCITPNGTYNDLEITIMPMEDARPGFDTDYKLIYKNKGTTILSGTIEFGYNDDLMNLLSATPVADSQAVGNLSWNYSNLLPFETREIAFIMTLNTPTNPTFPLNGDDVLEFVTSINPTETDETEDDNMFTLNQVVVNSYDPNDKTCLEGLMITPEQVGDYVHYRIRFENTGTASAVNVVVKDVIDVTKYDISTFVPLHASHTYETRIRNNNEVEFIFENIQLPFDDANNDGYIFFKIKTLPSLVLGDSFSNQAEIYFDFNFPIITNNETTVVEENLSIDEFDLSNSLRLYPNPSGTYFEIQNVNRISLETIELYDISGKKLKQFTVSERYVIDELVSGIYFVKIITESSEITKKIIKM